jgi:spondin N
MRRLLLLGLALALTLGLTAASATADSSATRSWRVTVENLTPAGSQPLSPPLFAVHGKRVDVWSVGDIANHGVAAIAEDANNAPLESALGQLAGVRDVFTGAGGPIPSGESRSYTVEGRAGGDRLTLLTMLVNTNDGFTGLDSLQLRGERTVLYRMAYDAGSERNNELRAFIPGPCCNNPFVRDPEGALIAPHAGITGTGELDAAVYGWDEPVAKITIQRMG